MNLTKYEELGKQAADLFTMRTVFVFKEGFEYKLFFDDAVLCDQLLNPNIDSCALVSCLPSPDDEKGRVPMLSFSAASIENVISCLIRSRHAVLIMELKDE